MRKRSGRYPVYKLPYIHRVRKPKERKLARVALGLTTAELSIICQCSKQTISNVENGKYKENHTTMLVDLVLDELSKGHEEFILC
jgi:DNA-binding XRE family transcriptional regulator